MSNAINKSLNASSVGANTVNDPSPSSTLVNPASSIAANKVSKLPAASAVSIILYTSGAGSSSITHSSPSSTYPISHSI